MNDFLKAMGQFGMEGLGYEPEETMSLEEEMNEEIAMEAELDESYAQMDFANIVASTSQCEAILTAMAEREIGLESNEGRDAGEIYKEFGLEAVKDVVMRKAYSGWASLKALINTCINWLKQLIGLSVSSKKIFQSLAKKSKAMNKQLAKVQSKVSDKLVRDMPKYSVAIGKILNNMAKYVSDGENANSNIVIGTYGVNMTVDGFDKEIKKIKDSLEKYSDYKDEIKDLYDKDDTDEYEGSACYNHIKTSVNGLANLTKFMKSLSDAQKQYDKEVKALEKLRKELEKEENRKKYATHNTADKLTQLLNTKITLATKNFQVVKVCLKEFVRCADDCLTMAKGVYASLV